MTFQYIDGHVEQITGHDIKELLERARELFEREKGVIQNFEIEPEYPARWPDFS